jgi:hypothetical protein
VSAEAAATDPRAIAQRLALLPDRRMREARLLDVLVATAPPDAAWLLDAIATAGRAGGPPFDLALLAAVDLTGGDRLPYDRRREIFAAADALQLEACKELLLSDELDDIAQAARPRPLVPGSRPLTLGERKALARGWHRETLLRLIEDPHVDVVALLLANPHVTEEDVLRLATARRSSAAVLMLVLQSRKWSLRPRVRRALVRNPRLPLASALRLVGLLSETDLRELADDPGAPLKLVASTRRRLRAPM